MQQNSSLICEILPMARLDDRNILQLRHLVESRPSRAHDSVNIQNPSISWLCMLK
jgi:hypothetical protein